MKIIGLLLALLGIASALAQPPASPAVQRLTKRIQRAQLHDGNTRAFKITVLSSTVLRVSIWQAPLDKTQAAATKWLRQHHFISRKTTVIITDNSPGHASPLTEAMKDLNRLANQPAAAPPVVRGPSPVAVTMDAKILAASAHVNEKALGFRATYTDRHGLEVVVFNRSAYSRVRPRALRWLKRNHLARAGQRVLFTAWDNATGGDFIAYSRA